MATLTTLADVRALLQIQNTDEDDLLESFIDQAEGYAEGFCNTTLILGTRREFYNVRNGNSFVVQHKNINLIVSLKINDKPIEAFSTQTKRGYMFSGSTVTIVGERFAPGDTVQIEYMSGFDEQNVPKNLKRAITFIAAEMYRKRDRIGLASEQLQSGGSTTYVLTIDPQVEQILNDFKRVTPHSPIGTF